ncbi:hypothetical protein DFH07DRAFT_780749 [Mycena maculata]|uniref:Uncharacterized protein n=1 Tax=Mycena maculata TaxID=230809 RepID=A0AAD7I1C4_9AGAR|nr:hypothetical protein DFH07DRAFT_780749 [Mycena maculata]
MIRCPSADDPLPVRGRSAARLQISRSPSSTQQWAVARRQASPSAAVASSARTTRHEFAGVAMCAQFKHHIIVGGKGHAHLGLIYWFDPPPFFSVYRDDLDGAKHDMAVDVPSAEMGYQWMTEHGRKRGGFDAEVKAGDGDDRGDGRKGRDGDDGEHTPAVCIEPANTCGRGRGFRVVSPDENGQQGPHLRARHVDPMCSAPASSNTSTLTRRGGSGSGSGRCRATGERRWDFKRSYERRLARRGVEFGVRHVGLVLSLSRKGVVLVLCLSWARTKRHASRRGNRPASPRTRETAAADTKRAPRSQTMSSLHPPTASPSVYKRDGFGLVYVNIRVPFVAIILYLAKRITLLQFLLYVDVKGGHSGSFPTRRCAYHKCERGIAIIWHCGFIAHRRILAEALTHQALRAMGVEPRVYPCPGCDVRHHEYFPFLKVGGFAGLEWIIRAAIRATGQREIEKLTAVLLSTCYRRNIPERATLERVGERILGLDRMDGRANTARMPDFLHVDDVRADEDVLLPLLNDSTTRFRCSMHKQGEARCREILREAYGECGTEHFLSAEAPPAGLLQSQFLQEDARMKPRSPQGGVGGRRSADAQRPTRKSIQEDKRGAENFSPSPDATYIAIGGRRPTPYGEVDPGRKPRVRDAGHCPWETEDAEVAERWSTADQEEDANGDKDDAQVLPD